MDIYCDFVGNVEVKGRAEDLPKVIAVLSVLDKWGSDVRSKLATNSYPELINVLKNAAFKKSNYRWKYYPLNKEL